MKILKLDLKYGESKLLVQNKEDLVPLSKIIQQGDIIIGKTERKIKLGGEDGRQKSIRKTITLEIKVIKIIFEESVLRVNGQVTKPTEDIPINSAHTIELTEGSEFKLKKKEWLNYQIEQLKNAETSSQIPKAFLCVLDDEQASFGHLSSSGIKYLGKINLRLTKKRIEEKKKDEIKKVAQEILEKAGDMQIIVASPLFWKELVFKAIKDINPAIAKKVLMGNVSTGSEKGLLELLSTGAVDNIIKNAEISRHEKIMNKLLEEIAKESLATYGFEQVEQAAQSSAVKDLLISEKLFPSKREELEKLIKQVEQAKGSIHILDKKSDAGKKLLGLSGIAAILKFKI
ncbi:mRNA surveillance protein pelota [Candidatus Woesearchaeota archaeon]|jgi:protein pelota|nr:mRNA surveillance protein pelota [Candidatus Woesearchaeota archaeon]MBT7062598.1 mRNA surveillance protein pelota [Candidatus Woesearchaeota archaeon]MBT7402757.1 mRNA surveillance protein pelota [Candidatus Woesearchaeota archaeon]